MAAAWQSAADEVFVPSFGDLFLIRRRRIHSPRRQTRFRPLFWGFVFNTAEVLPSIRKHGAYSFRPLFWGFVFNEEEKAALMEWMDDGFRPLFWGFVFNDA